MVLDDKIAIVTGGSRGIGKAICLQMATAGAKILVNYSGNKDAALEVVNEIKTLGGEAVAFKADVRQADQVQLMVEEAINKLGGLHILINNAGITRDNLLMRMKVEHWNEVIETNLTGVFNCTKAVIKPMMKQKYGCIINITSVVGQMGNAGQANYAAAKAGVIGFTKSMAKELATRNIRVNSVAPGYIITDMTRQLGEQVQEQIAKEIPLQRLGQVEDVAYLVSFLASDKASYITGQVFNIDGGMVM